MSDPVTVLVSVKLHSAEMGEAVLRECPQCFALVREEKLDMHIGSHYDN